MKYALGLYALFSSAFILRLLRDIGIVEDRRRRKEIEGKYYFEKLEQLMDVSDEAALMHLRTKLQDDAKFADIVGRLEE